MGPKTVPLRIIHARAPIRINDLGGWTDTWFAGRGKVLNLGVAPAVEVEVKVFPNPRRTGRRVTVHAENFRETFVMDPDSPRREPHGLLQFSVGSLPLARDRAFEIGLYSYVPAGISTGTSAAVSVALIGALNELQTEKLGWAEISRLAHRVETESLGQQSGIQDQIAAAHGGITFIDMPRYPDARVRAVKVGPSIWREIDRRLCLVYLGRPHRSSAIHQRVIAELEAGGPQMKIIEALTRIAGEARRFLAAGELDAYGEAMIRNNACQRALSDGLVSPDADAVASLAGRYGAAGWKVNGAGGKGGSMTVLASGDDVLRWRMIQKIDRMGGGIRVIPVALSPAGLQAWEGRKALEPAAV
jgi:D-glycero-alpha-D-manno-heptose-7-phosphate kinase